MSPSRRRASSPAVAHRRGARLGIARGGSPPRCVAWQVAHAESFAGASPCAPHSRAGRGVQSPHPRHGRGTVPLHPRSLARAPLACSPLARPYPSPSRPRPRARAPRPRALLAPHPPGPPPGRRHTRLPIQFGNERENAHRPCRAFASRNDRRCHPLIRMASNVTPSETPFLGIGRLDSRGGTCLSVAGNSGFRCHLVPRLRSDRTLHR